VSFNRQILALLIACGFPAIGAATACNPSQNEQCQGPDELVRQAATLNAAGRYTEAADLLERVLMQHPDAGGAVEQYNQALAGIDGQPQIQASQQNIDPRQWQLSSGLQMRGGYSSNLNQAPSQSTVQLTLPSGIVAVELQEQFHRQAGFGVETLLSGNAVRAVADRMQWQVRGELFNRETGYSGYADYQGVNLLTSLMQHGEGGTETGGALGYSALRYGGDVYLSTVQMLLRHTGQEMGYCRPQAGGDLLWQRQHGNPLLDSRYTGLMAGLFCDTKLGYYSAAISAGWDWASSQRPGGDQLRGKLDLTGAWFTDAIVQDSFVRAYASILQSNDSKAYSPWLSHGAKRYVSRIGLGLDYDWPLALVGDNWRGVASVKWQDQNSNISLFEMKTTEGWLGVRVGW
jgi:hypothetical protein